MTWVVGNSDPIQVLIVGKQNFDCSLPRRWLTWCKITVAEALHEYLPAGDKQCQTVTPAAARSGLLLGLSQDRKFRP